jgi:hypothetical protein
VAGEVAAALITVVVEVEVVAVLQPPKKALPQPFLPLL